jgi:ribosomal protein S18 acetylase RimI-like enzyme
LSELAIRAFREDDRDEVITLWRDCGLVVPQNDPARDIARKLKVNRELFLVGTEGGDIVATVMGGYEGHRGWINYLAVKPSARRRGYGGAMMRAVENDIEALGCPKINLQVRSSNADVIAFYEAIGYRQDDVVGLGKRLEHDT